MPYKITRKQFIEELENDEEGLKPVEFAKKFNISLSYFYKLRKKYQNDIVDAAKEYAKIKAIEQIKELERQSKKGTTPATTAMLEISKVKTKESFVPEGTDWKITIEKVTPEKQEK